MGSHGSAEERDLLTSRAGYRAGTDAPLLDQSSSTKSDSPGSRAYSDLSRLPALRRVRWLGSFVHSEEPRDICLLRRSREYSSTERGSLRGCAVPNGQQAEKHQARFHEDFLGASEGAEVLNTNSSAKLRWWQGIDRLALTQLCATEIGAGPVRLGL